MSVKEAERITTTFIHRGAQLPGGSSRHSAGSPTAGGAAVDSDGSDRARRRDAARGGQPGQPADPVPELRRSKSGELFAGNK